jgi:hypothetical protein
MRERKALVSTVNLAARQDDAIPDGVVFYPIRLRRGSGKSAHQSEARCVRQDPRVQILRGAS